MKIRLSERSITRELNRLREGLIDGEIGSDEFARRDAILNEELGICVQFQTWGRMVVLEFIAYLICLALRLSHAEVPLMIGFMFLFCGTWHVVEGYRKIAELKSDFHQELPDSVEKRTETRL